jgi:hypothetical protein
MGGRLPEVSFNTYVRAHRCRRGASTPSEPSEEDAPGLDDDMVFDASDETTLHSLVDPPRVGRLRHGANMQWIEMLLDVRL